LTAPPPEPSLDDEEKAALAKGVAEFNAGLFFECHDTLEEMWAGVRGPSRDFFQGLIQVSVAFYHLGNGNAAGAESMFTRALKRLAKYPGRYCGFDLAAHRGEIERWRRNAAEGDVTPMPVSALPKWRFEAAGDD
jgi:hypothetical protein